MEQNSSHLSNLLLSAIYVAQKEFIASNWSIQKIFDMLLETLLKLTSSQYGFIGKVLQDTQGAPYLKTYSITNIAWNEDTRKFFEDNVADGIEFRNLKTLFGSVMTSQKAVISNSPKTDPRSGGIPFGHPALESFLGIPFFIRDRMIGMAGIANSPNGYNEDTIKFLEPFSSTCATILMSLEENEEKQKFQSQLALVNDRYELALTASNDGYWDWDLQTDVIYFSPRWKEMFGYTDSEFENTMDNWKKIILPDDLLKALELTEDFISGKTSEFKAVQRFRHKNGTTVHILSRAIRQKDDKGKVIRLVGAHTDITEQVKNEENLTIAKEKAEGASRAKAEFLSTMSHEIRTPMNGVIGTTHLLLESNLAPYQKELVETLKFSADHLMNLINDILDFSKIESGKLKLEKNKFPLRFTLEQIIKLHSPKAKEKGIQIVSSIAEDIPDFLIGDSLRLGQVINNLLNNAIKFTEKGKVEFIVRLESLNENTAVILFEIVDTGIGIPLEYQQKVFEAFTQENSRNERKYGGTGLGLSISRKLIEIMKSEIHLESELGKGSKFYFSLSLERASSWDQEIEKENADLSKLSLKGKKLLLVEDNDVNIILASRFFEKWGIAFDVATNGIKAIEKIQDKSYDIVLMDLQMPEMDGFEACRLIRSREDKYFQQVPILALSADVFLESKNKAQDYKMNDFISKPFRPEELYQKILKYANVL